MRAFLVGVAAALVAVVVWGWTVPATPEFEVGYEATDRIGQILYKSGDGQIVARLAQDPLLEEPSRIFGPAETAYRWQRPVPVWLAWLFGAGNPDWTAVGLFVSMVVGVGLLTHQLVRFGLPLWVAVAFLVTPGILSSYRIFGPDALGLALVLFGWRTDRVWPHVIAGLIRESLLIPSLAIALVRQDIRHLTPLTVFLGWSVVVNQRIGAWFLEANFDRVGGLPASALGDWPTRIVLVATVGVAVWLAYRHRLDEIGVMAVGYLALVLILGADVWQSWKHVGRVATPLYAFALLSVYPIFQAQRAGLYWAVTSRSRLESTKATSSK